MNPRTIQSLLYGLLAVASVSVAVAAPAAAKPESAAYNKIVFDTIGARWYSAVESKHDLVRIGTVRLTFRITFDGHVRNLKIVSNTSNEEFAKICVRAVNGAKLAPIPQKVIKETGRDWIDFDIPFKILN